MNKQTARHGFTITELVIVIVVIAILAAVLIPTFVSLINKANQSADIQAARQMNTVLKAESAVKKPDDIQDVIEILDAADYNVNSLTPVTKDHAFMWCPTDNVILLINTAEDAVVHPTEKAIVDNYAAHKVVMVNLADGASYINVEASSSEEAQAALGAGSDLSLKEDVAIVNTVRVPAGKEQTIDLNGKDLDASGNTSRPFEMSEGSTLTINAEGSTIKAGLYGLVNVPSGTSGNIVINGGTIESNMDNGAFIKLRSGGGDVNITLNNVTFVDASNNSYVINDIGHTGKLNMTVKGGSYTSQFGFQFDGSGTFEDVTINSKASGIYAEGKGNTVTVKNCKITSGTAMQYAAQGTPGAAVMVASECKMTVINCVLTAAKYNYAVLNTGGAIEATNTTTNGAGVPFVLTPDAGKTCTLTIDGVAFTG